MLLSLQPLLLQVLPSLVLTKLSAFQQLCGRGVCLGPPILSLQPPAVVLLKALLFETSGSVSLLLIAP